MILVPLLLAVAIVPAGNSFECTPIAVWDGDGPVWCAEGPHLRLAGIAAREIDGTCRDNQPCPAADAVQARDALAGLLGRRVGVSSDGHVLIRGQKPALRFYGLRRRHEDGRMVYHC
jgi:endonuclease YncB( thermonuclease family)